MRRDASRARRTRLGRNARLTFRTRQVHDPAGFVRTFGTVVEARPGDLRFGAGDAIAHAPGEAPGDCARGKVAAFSREGGDCQAICYQLSDCRSRAEVVGCSNATAAVAARHAQTTGRRDVRIRMELPGRRHVRIEARVGEPACDAAAALPVDQHWLGIPFSVDAQASEQGREYAICAGPLNDYLIVRVKDELDFARFPVDEALRLWRCFGLAREPLRSRIAIVQERGAAAPRTRFFTCGERAHPSAPLTGLAVLALAARQLGWDWLATAREVETPRAPMPLPRVASRDDGTADAEFPRVLVQLGPGRESRA